jgi:hypothetical protein
VPTAEQAAIVAAKAARGADGEWDWAVYKAVYERELAVRHERLRTDARAVHRAIDGWGRIKDEADWLQLIDKAEDDLASGRFLLDQLGAERYLEPELMAALVVLRRRLICEHRVSGAADLLLIDSALIAWYHTLRINGWVGNFTLLVEHEFFQLEGPTAKLRKRYGYGVEALKAEDTVMRLVLRSSIAATIGGLSNLRRPRCRSCCTLAPRKMLPKSASCASWRPVATRPPTGSSALA